MQFSVLGDYEIFGEFRVCVISRSQSAVERMPRERVATLPRHAFSLYGIAFFYGAWRSNEA